MIPRELKTKLLALQKSFPVIALLGPRQSGKTTLVKSTFEKYAYRNLEAPDTRLYIQSDPRGFLELSHTDKGLIIDEAQRVPELFSYIQEAVDENKGRKIILTGSQNFLLHEKISQSLAGRIGILRLLPFSLNEIKTDYHFENYTDYIFKGFYPPVYDRNILPGDWAPNYIQTYIEKDVRQIINISDLTRFSNFLKLCSGRIGQILNITSLANDAGVAVNTAKSWLSVLESCFVIFLLKPFYNNFNKRIIKSPKLYFIDTGLASSLLEIEDSKQIESHYLKGALFENFIIAELLKRFFNKGDIPRLYYWRDKLGNEMDCLIEVNDKVKVVEMKAGKTITEDFFKGLNYWGKITASDNKNLFLIYGGNETQSRSSGKVLSWKNIEGIFNRT